jgi:hypothetical protein
LLLGLYGIVWGGRGAPHATHLGNADAPPPASQAGLLPSSSSSFAVAAATVKGAAAAATEGSAVSDAASGFRLL